MNAPRKGAETDHTKIVLEWDTPDASKTGNSQITKYEIYMKENGVFKQQVIDTVQNMGQKHTFSVGIKASTQYTFKMRMENVYGWGPYSQEISILAADASLKPTNIQTTIN